jgi:hypothetical protein
VPLQQNGHGARHVRLARATTEELNCATNGSKQRSSNTSSVRMNVARLTRS